ncbi:hypothetical protein [Taibaiella koreensis]|uniref:hypothetical protein n=1 Tax=Taibaiella koreensis TaxID=1268548 RepID=UPI000E59DB3E|nr:hypothetical protein [Taibaiella koreensis]
MPGIDRDYWLDFAKESVAKSIQSREDAAIKLDDFLAWLWGIYTSIFALASLLGYIGNDVSQLVAVSQPILVIMLARFACKMVLMPATSDNESADPNVVPEIIESFIIIVSRKKEKLRFAVVLTWISIFSLCFALVGYNLFDANKEIKLAIQQAKLKKELRDQAVAVQKQQQAINDSLKLINEFYEQAIQSEIKKRKLDCIRANDGRCLDSLKKWEK